MTALILSDDQQNALDKIVSFLLDPLEPVFLLRGYSGTGKSTLVKHFLEQLPKYLRTAKLINPNFRDMEVELTATTNKAAEALKNISGMEVRTIHSSLGLRLQQDYHTGEKHLVSGKGEIKEWTILIIDEASFLDSHLLSLIFQYTANCKIILMGDPAQLLAVKAQNAPAFEAGFKGAELTQVVRQAAGNPIVEVSTMFRKAVLDGIPFQFKPDGKFIKHVTGPEFQIVIEAEFNRPDWKHSDSKVLAYRNETVIAYNHHIRDVVKGDPHFQIGDYAVVNKYLVAGKGLSFKTDQTVQITDKSEQEIKHGLPGHYYTLDNRATVFVPDSLFDKNALIKWGRNNNKFEMADEADNKWGDLRSEFAQTVNKSQGSTYDRVYIDLTDISRVTNANHLYRMMYVAISRARYEVCLKGDFV